MKLSYKDILNCKKVGDLFSKNDLVICKKEYRELIKLWHPDVSSHPESSTVIEIINKLYTRAVILIRENKWEKSNHLTIVRKSDGKVLESPFLKEHPFELGTMYICNNFVIYILKKEFKNYYDNALSIENLLKKRKQKHSFEFQKNKNGEMLNHCITIENEFCLIYEKKRNLICLKDLLEYYKTVDPKHVAWILSRLYSIKCFLELVKLTHNDINLDSCFIDPKEHSLYLIGGWWYSVEEGKKMIGVKKEIYNLFSFKNKSLKLGEHYTDLVSIKDLGKKLLNGNIKTPNKYADYLRSTTSNNPLEEFKKYDKCLDDSFGVRKFVELKVTSDVVYKN